MSAEDAATAAIPFGELRNTIARQSVSSVVKDFEGHVACGNLGSMVPHVMVQHFKDIENFSKIFKILAIVLDQNVLRSNYRKLIEMLIYRVLLALCISSTLMPMCVKSQTINGELVADFKESQVYLDNEANFLLVENQGTAKLCVIHGLNVIPYAISPSVSGTICAAFMPRSEDVLIVQRSNPFSVKRYKKQSPTMFVETNIVADFSDNARLLAFGWPDTAFVRTQNSIVSVGLLSGKQRTLMTDAPVRGLCCDTDDLSNMFLLMPGVDSDGELHVATNVMDDLGASFRDLVGYSYMGVCASFATICRVNWQDEQTVIAHITNVSGYSCPESSAIYVWSNGCLLDIARLDGFVRCHSLTCRKGVVFALISKLSYDDTSFAPESLQLTSWERSLGNGLTNFKSLQLSNAENLVDVKFSRANDCVYGISATAKLYRFALEGQ